MTQSTNVTLFCDGTLPSGHPCPSTYGSGVVISTAWRAREQAAELGWTNRGGSDYCPECSEGGS